GRASDHLLRQQLLGCLLSEPAVVEQQGLLGWPASHVATSTLASTDSSSGAAADTAPADNPTGSVARAAWRKASIGWEASAIGHPASFYRQTAHGWPTPSEHPPAFQAAARQQSAANPGKWLNAGIASLQGRDDSPPRPRAHALIVR